MKRLLLAIVLILPLTGCAGLAESVFNLPTGVLTKSIQNPVTTKQLYEIENGLVIAVVALNVYKDKCIRKEIEQSCRNTVRRLQTYTRKAPPLIKSLRSFVRENDQVNARVVFNSLYGLFTNFRALATAKGVM
jgi:hypothetical protein